MNRMKMNGMMFKKYCLMKKITLFSAAVLCIIAAASWAKEINDLKDTPIEEEIRTTTLCASIVETKTALGPKEGTSWPNYWKTGDKLSVNGVESDALDAADDGKTTATFDFAGTVSVPYYAAYPASAVSGYSAGSATLTFPESQNYVAGSYDPSAFIMMGNGTVAGEVALAAQVSVFHVSLTGTASITKVKLTGEAGKALSGTYTTDFSTLTPGTVSNVVEMVASTPVALSATPSDFFICVPAGLDGEVILEVFDDAGGSMKKKRTLPSALTAGHMYSPKTLAYAASYAPNITAEGITSSTAIICWDNAPTASFSIGVYSNAGCTALINNYVVPASDACWGGSSPRFCISGLEPSTTYYVKVRNEDEDEDSNILPVTTADFTIVQVSSTAAAVGDVILAEDFGELRWDSELIGSGVGYFPTSLSSFANAEVDAFRAVGTSSEKVLSAQSDALAASRLAHWAQGANANLYIHPGYIKLVGNSKVTHVVTPALDNIPDGKLATVEVTVTASAYYSESSHSYATKNAVVAVQPAGSYNELTDETKTNTLDLTTNVQPITLDEATAWKEYTVTLTGVGKGARLAFGAASTVSGNDARMNISDMKVTIKALEDPGLVASVKAVSSSSAVFTWTYGGEAAADIAKPYTIALYSDSACSNLVVSFNVDADASCWDNKVPCFVFGGLNPGTEYWFVATDTDAGISSDPVSATTEAFTPVDATTVTNAAVGDVILAEDFSEIGWGPDVLGVAAGFVPSPKAVGAPSGTNPSGSFTEYDNTGNRFFGSGVDLGTSRLSKGWGFFGNSSVYLHNGYSRVGASGGRTHIVTPALFGIPAGKVATLDVTITATKYDSSIDISVFAEKGLTMNSTPTTSSSSYRKYTGASLNVSEASTFGITTKGEWQTKTASISNVDSECQLIIGSLEDHDSKNRFYLSDVKVTITALADDPVFKIKDEATFQAFVSEVAGGNKTLDAEVKADVVISSSAADAFSSIEDYEGTLNGNGKTISGLTKPLFNDLKGTVKDLTLNSTLNITADQLDLGILANVLSGTADGCASQGSVTFNVAGGVTGEHHIAGLIGMAKEGATMTDCTNEATVTNETSNASGNSNELMVGGVLGTFWGVEFSISGCENTGAVINNGAWNKDVSVGGIIGQAGNSSSLSCNMTVSDCTNSGTVTNNGANDGATNSVGGVIGWIRFGTYTGNSNTGAVTNSGNATHNRVGGVIGYLDKGATFDDNTNSGTVSNSGISSYSPSKASVGGNFVGGLIGRMQTDNTFKNNSNSGAVYNSGDATNDLYIGGIVGYLDKNNVISDAGSSAMYKLTNSGDIENSGSAKNICIGGLFGRNSSGYFNMTGTSSKYSTNSGKITDSSGPAKSNGGDLSIGGIAGYTTTGIKTQFARNTGRIYVTGDKGNTSINVGGIGGWISNASFNFNNCRNTGDVIIDATTTASIWAAGIVACPKPNTTNHYYWYMNATIDTHAATAGGDNYTAGLFATVEGSDASSVFTMTGHKLAGTAWGNKTTTGLVCCTKNASASFSIKMGDSTHQNMIAPGTVRKDNVNDNTVNGISDVNIGLLAGGAGSTYDLTSVIADGHLIVQDW